jgi:hypothetical protein
MTKASAEAEVKLHAPTALCPRKQLLIPSTIPSVGIEFRS